MAKTERVWLGMVLPKYDYVVGKESLCLPDGRLKGRDGYGVRDFFQQLIDRGVTDIVQTTVSREVYGVLPKRKE